MLLRFAKRMELVTHPELDAPRVDDDVQVEAVVRRGGYGDAATAASGGEHDRDHAGPDRAHASSVAQVMSGPTSSRKHSLTSRKRSEYTKPRGL